MLNGKYLFTCLLNCCVLDFLLSMPFLLLRAGSPHREFASVAFTFAPPGETTLKELVAVRLVMCHGAAVFHVFGGVGCV